jgi:glucose-1-phosphate thymidylyltransferase
MIKRIRKGEMIAVIPAAGSAERLGALPCSKAILPVGFSQHPNGSGRVRVAIEDAIEALSRAGVSRLIILIGPDSLDIPAYLGSGAPWKMKIAYRIVEESPSVPFSLDQARPFVLDQDVVLTFPDTLFTPADAIERLVNKWCDSQADVLLALVPTDKGHKMDLVTKDDSDRVIQLDVKPGPGQSGWTWFAAVWNPRFTEFMHDELRDSLRQTGHPAAGTGERRRELGISDLINKAMSDAMDVQVVTFGDGSAHDIGTIDDLERSWGGNT